MKRKKRIIITIGVLVLLLSLLTSPVLASAPADTSLKESGGSRYNNLLIFEFIHDYVGSMNTATSANEIYVTGAGKVQQSLYTDGISIYGVNYYLFRSDLGVTNMATAVATVYDDQFVHYMPYNSGYGSVGEEYTLAGYPNAFYFQYYYVEGVWDSSVNNPQY